MEVQFFIGGNTPSSKNNRQWTGEYFVASKNTQDWRKWTKLQWELQKAAFIEATKDLPKPLYIEFTFIRKSKHKFDYNNLSQTLQDEMTFHGWIPDDNADEIKPFFGDYVHNKDNPGCLIRILTSKPNL